MRTLTLEDAGDTTAVIVKNLDFRHFRSLQQAQPDVVFWLEQTIPQDEAKCVSFRQDDQD